MGFAHQLLIGIVHSFALATPAFPHQVSGPAGALIDRAQALAQADRPSQVRSARQGEAAELVILADRASGKEGEVLVYEGYVDAGYGSFRLQSDRLTFDTRTQDVEAVGNVVYDYECQRITGSRALFNIRTRRGKIWNAYGYTDRTPDGVTLYFQAHVIERTGVSTYVVEDGRITACEQTVPQWSFSTRRMELSLNQRVKLKTTVFQVKNIPVVWLPYVSVPISRRVRSSGFLLPSFGNSNVRGRSINVPYYQTLGESADVLLRLDAYAERGIGAGLDFRSRTGARSRFNAGFFTVFDRLFGEPGPKQGGTAFYVDAAQFLPKGFVASADVNVVSNFDFRQVFSDSFQQSISPEERTQIYLNNNFSNYSFNFLLQSRNVFLPRTLVTIRQLPSFGWSSRPQRLSRLWPIYLDVDATLEGVRRTESILSTPSIVQRLDVAPRLTIPLVSAGGFSLASSIMLRSTFYSDSADPNDRTRILGRSITRRYIEAAVELRPPSLARLFHHRDGRGWFKHLIETSVTYRRIAGIDDDFSRVIRFDEKDAIASTSEVEYSMTHRFLTKRTSEGGGPAEPHEWLSVRFSQKYFLDPAFGGALAAGERNQFFPINTLSGFSFGGRPRRFSPLAVGIQMRPSASLFGDLRLDYDVDRGKIRNTRLTAGFQHRFFSFAQTWFYTRQLSFASGLSEPGVFSGNLTQSSIFAGNREKGFFGGFDVAYDFAARTTPSFPSPRHLITSSARVGYGFCCGSFQIQNTIFKLGLRSENRITFAFSLNGIGSFGTQTAAGRRIFGQ